MKKRHKSSIMGNKGTLNLVIKHNKSSLPTMITHFIAMLEKILGNKFLNKKTVLIDVRDCGML